MSGGGGGGGGAEHVVANAEHVAKLDRLAFVNSDTAQPFSCIILQLSGMVSSLGFGRCCAGIGEPELVTAATFNLAVHGSGGGGGGGVAVINAADEDDDDDDDAPLVTDCDGLVCVVYKSST